MSPGPHGSDSRPAFTVLGGSGFIGSHLVAALKALGETVEAPRRGEPLTGRDLGHVVDCVGLTADFRRRPFDTVEAHVGHLARVLRDADFRSLLYLSSTRVYDGAGDGRETATLSVNPSRPDDLYNLSKLTGEALCLNSPRPGVRVARLSNVYGPDFRSENFLTSLVRDAVSHGRVRLRTTLTSAKDYVAVGDVVALLPRIARHGQERIYNVASGRRTTNGEIVAELRHLTGSAVGVDDEAEERVFPEVAIDRVRDEFGFAPGHVLDALPGLVEEFRRGMTAHDRDD